MISISTIEEMQLIGNNVSYPLDGDYELANDIDASDTINWNGGLGFDPIGTTGSEFTGTFNGNRYTITNLYINRPLEYRIGFFGACDGAYINNISLISIEVYGKNSVGGLIGEAYDTTFNNIYVQGSITGSTVDSFGVGGIVGYLYQLIDSIIYNCNFSGTVEGIFSVGGLIGELYAEEYFSSFESCNIQGTITGGVYGIAGLVGALYVDPYGQDIAKVNGSYINNCSAKVSILASGVDVYAVGGLIGDYYGPDPDPEDGEGIYTISNSYTTGSIIVNDVSVLQYDHLFGVGGIVAVAYDNIIISDCYSTMNITFSSTTSACCIAGIIGDVESSFGEATYKVVQIISCYFTGNILCTVYENAGMTYPSANNINSVGGLVGSLVIKGTLNCIQCGVTSTISANAPYITDCGSLIGLPGTFNRIDDIITITECYTQVDFLSTYIQEAISLGGFIGGIWSGSSSVEYVWNINKCYSAGSINGSREIGGFIGDCWGDSVHIHDCYSTVSVKGDSKIGGFFGVYGIETNAVILVENCYSSGYVNGNTLVGGFTGYEQINHAPLYSTITSCYWDTEASGQPSSDGGVGKSTSQMQAIATFSGWDFDSLWGISLYDAYKYPKFYCAEFTVSAQAGVYPLTVDLVDTSVVYTSPVQTILWDFGDGETSSVQNPSHVYTHPGSYTVILTLVNTSNEVTRYQISPIVVSKFSDIITFDIAVSPKDYNSYLCVNTGTGVVAPSEGKGARIYSYGVRSTNTSGIS